MSADVTQLWVSVIELWKIVASPSPLYLPQRGGMCEEASKDLQEEISTTVKLHGSASPLLGEVGWGPHGSQVSPVGGDLEGASAWAFFKLARRKSGRFFELGR